MAQIEKKNYFLWLNAPLQKYSHILEYKYSNILMTIHLSKDQLAIEYTSASKKTIDGLFSTTGISPFRDALKKAELCHILYYGKPFKQDKLQVCIRTADKTTTLEEKTLYTKETAFGEPFLYSMIEQKTLTPVSSALTEPSLIKQYLQYTQTTAKSNIACLYALLLSQTKAYETERFLYLWTAMNGFYDTVYTYCKEQDEFFTTGKGKNLGDRDQICLLSILFGYGINEIPSADEKQIYHEVVQVLKDYDLNQPIGELLENSDFCTAVEKRLFAKHYIDERVTSEKERKKQHSNSYYKDKGERYDLTAYGYLLLYGPYFFRCSKFHGNRPIQLFSLAEEDEVVVLRFLNNILQDFLSKHMEIIFQPEKFLPYYQANQSEVIRLFNL